MNTKLIPIESIKLSETDHFQMVAYIFGEKNKTNPGPEPGVITSQGGFDHMTLVLSSVIYLYL